MVQMFYESQFLQCFVQFERNVILIAANDLIFDEMQLSSWKKCSLKD